MKSYSIDYAAKVAEITRRTTEAEKKMLERMGLKLEIKKEFARPSYNQIEIFISYLENGLEMMEQFETIRGVSLSEDACYESVLKWFNETFPYYGQCHLDKRQANSGENPDLSEMRGQCHLDKRQANSGENPDLSEMRGWDFFITKKTAKGLTRSEKSAAKPFETRNSKGAATHGQIPCSVEGKSQQAHR